MTNKKIIGLFATTALFASLSSVANSQVTISGYVEASYMTGNGKTGGTTAINQTLSRKGLQSDFHL